MKSQMTAKGGEGSGTEQKEEELMDVDNTVVTEKERGNKGIMHSFVYASAYLTTCYTLQLTMLN